MQWLTVCVVLRASGMPLPLVRHYTELVRRGAGTEARRLTLMRMHRDRIDAQIQELAKCLDLINYKIRVYEDITEEIDADPAAPPPGTPRRR